MSERRRTSFFAFTTTHNKQTKKRRRKLIEGNECSKDIALAKSRRRRSANSAMAILLMLLHNASSSASNIFEDESYYRSSTGQNKTAAMSFRNVVHSNEISNDVPSLTPSATRRPYHPGIYRFHRDYASFLVSDTFADTDLYNRSRNEFYGSLGEGDSVISSSYNNSVSIPTTTFRPTILTAPMIRPSVSPTPSTAKSYIDSIPSEQQERKSPHGDFVSLQPSTVIPTDPPIIPSMSPTLQDSIPMEQTEISWNDYNSADFLQSSQRNHSSNPFESLSPSNYTDDDEAIPMINISTTAFHIPPPPTPYPPPAAEASTPLQSTQTSAITETQRAPPQKDWNSVILSGLLNVTLAAMHDDEATVAPTPVPFDWNSAIQIALLNVSETVAMPHDPPKTKETYNAASTLVPTMTLEWQEFFLHGLIMTFDDCGLLNWTSIGIWEGVTARHTSDEIFTQTMGDLSDLYVDVTFMNQEDAPIGNSGRRMQQSPEPLWIVFDVNLSFFSTSSTIFSYGEVEQWIGNAYNTPTVKNEYIAELKRTGDPTFFSITDLTLYIDGVPQMQEAQNPSHGKSGKNEVATNVLVGAIVGGVAFLMLGAVFGVLGLRFYRKRRKDKNKGTHKTESTSNSRSERNVSKIIQVEVMEDVSTLGDPIFYPELPPNANDEKDTVGESLFSVDYDYTGAFRQKGILPSVSTTGATGTRSKVELFSLGVEGDISTHTTQGGEQETELTNMKRHPSVFSEDTSFEEQYNTDNPQTSKDEIIEIDAPPGKLGVVIDAPNGGPPMVQAMRESSVLASRLRVGDRLVSFDGMDVTGMTSSKVSQMINMSSHCPKRRLVFVRDRTWL